MTSKIGRTAKRASRTRKAPITAEGVYCPLCDDRFAPSEYLTTVFTDLKINWLAQLVTHYRHNHIEYYDHSVGFHSMRGTYEPFKHVVNERIKRQILRKCQGYMRFLGLGARDLKELQGTTEETLALAGQLLEGVKRFRIKKSLRIEAPRKKAQASLEDFA